MALGVFSGWGREQQMNVLFLSEWMCSGPGTLLHASGGKVKYGGAAPGALGGHHRMERDPSRMRVAGMARKQAPRHV